jgi:hypothetical protein
MTDDGALDREQTSAGSAVEVPAKEENRAAEEIAGAALTAEVVAPRDQPDAIRRIFVARVTASSEASAVGFASMESADASFVLRGAYMAHLTGAEAGTGGGDLSGGEVLRKAYLAHAVTGAPAPKAGRSQTKRSARSGRTATKPKTKVKKASAKASPSSRAKAAKRAAPRAGSASPAKRGGGRPVRKGKKSRR